MKIYSLYSKQMITGQGLCRRPSQLISLLLNRAINKQKVLTAKVSTHIKCRSHRCDCKLQRCERHSKLREHYPTMKYKRLAAQTQNTAYENLHSPRKADGNNPSLFRNLHLISNQNYTPVSTPTD